MDAMFQFSNKFWLFYSPNFSRKSEQKKEKNNYICLWVHMSENMHIFMTE